MGPAKRTYFKAMWVLGVATKVLLPEMERGGQQIQMVPQRFLRSRIIDPFIRQKEYEY